MVDKDKPKPKRIGTPLTSLIGEVDGAATLGDTDDGAAPAGVSTLPVDAIRPDPQQPRRHFDPDALAELAASIRAHGVIQAIVVRPDDKAAGRYHIVAGERRWRAAKQAGLEAIPALVREANELARLEVGIIENVQREGLNPIEEAEAYQALIQRFHKTQQGLSEAVGKSREHIANTLRLLQLPDGVREHVREGRLTAGAARALLAFEDPESAAEEAIAKQLSVRAIEGLARKSRGAGASGSGSATPGEKDVDTKALEADLERALGLEVDIRDKKGSGELRIRYRDLEQLDEVCRRLTRQRA